MNEKRRGALKDVLKKIDDFRGKQGEEYKALQKKLEEVEHELEELLGEVQTEVQEWVDEINGIKEEEEEALDNMPDGLKEGEKGERAQAAIEAMGTAIDALEEIVNLSFDEVRDGEGLDKLDEAEGGVQEAIDA